MRRKQLKKINRKLDYLINKIEILSIALNLEKKREADDHYFDPTKFPDIEGNIENTSEYNKHFE